MFTSKEPKGGGGLEGLVMWVDEALGLAGVLNEENGTPKLGVIAGVGD